MEAKTKVMDAPSDGVAAKVQELEQRIADLEEKNNNLTMVLFSGDFDKPFADFVRGE